MPVTSKTIEAVSDYDLDELVVPTGDAFMDNATNEIEGWLQKLINGARWLKDHAGKLDADNVWLGLQDFRNYITFKRQVMFVPNLLEAYFQSDTTPLNTWQPAGSFKFSGNQYCHLYIGSNANSHGAFAVVINAYWRKNSGDANYAWQQQNVSVPSVALLVRYADVRIARQDAGTAPWASWPQPAASLGAEMLSEAFRAARMLVAANTNADQTNGYRYTSAVARTSPIPMGTLWGDVRWSPAMHALRAQIIEPYIYVPIRIPPFCTFGAVRVHFFQLQPNTPDEWQLMKRNGTSGWQPIKADGSVGINVEVHNTFGEVTATLHGSVPAQLVHDDEEWCYRWKVVSGDLAVQSNRIVGASVDWSDIGPSNGVS